MFLHDRALGPPVGAIPGTEYETVTGELRSGDRLLLYTDGLIEDRQVGIDVALAQLRADAARPGEHVADLIEAVVERVVDRPRRDDVAVLALEAAELDRFTLRLPADPMRLSVLRKRLEEFLVAHEVSESDLFDLTVAVSEAAANAIEHPVDPAEPTIGVEVSVADRVVVATVRDTGRWRESTGSGFRGRGLSLIRALGELSVSRTPEGTEVTLRRRLDPGGSASTQPALLAQTGDLQHPADLSRRQHGQRSERRRAGPGRGWRPSRRRYRAQVERHVRPAGRRPGHPSASPCRPRRRPPRGGGRRRSPRWRRRRIAPLIHAAT